MQEPIVQWAAPAPLWPGLAGGAGRAAFRQPEILRFATDTFMDELKTMLDHEPARLGEWRAERETWQSPSAAPAAIKQLPPVVQRLNRLRLATVGPAEAMALAPRPTLGALREGPLKLYQPAHQRFYLVSACLVCRVPGLPDRRVDQGAGERVGFVVRRLRPRGKTPPATYDLDTCDEYALAGGRWVRAEADELATGEELQPMFPLAYAEADGRRRRLLGAVVPVGRRESYLAAQAEPILDDPPPVPPDARKAVLLRAVTDPWRSVVEQAGKVVGGLSKAPPPGLKDEEDEEPEPPPADALKKVQRIARDQTDLLSWLILIDLGDFLMKYLEPVWDVITDQAPRSSLSGKTLALYDKLAAATYTDPDTHVTMTLPAALRAMRDWTSIEGVSEPFEPPATGPLPSGGPYPDFRFPLSADDLPELVNPPEGGQTLDDAVAEALAEHVAPADTPPLPLAATLASGDAREAAWFVIRCVFERPNCVPLATALLSEATRPFQMAAFFDPEAPARPIRINLPIDTTPAGLRKFDKNTAFMLSDALCGQMKRMGGLTLGDLVLSVLPWPLHKDLEVPDEGPCGEGSTPFGLICSLSIPIITICALILLIIIVSLLDLIFRWIPFFISCFPIPNFSAKEE